MVELGIKKKVLVLCSVGRNSAAVRYRVLHTLEVLRQHDKVEYDFFSVYSDATMAVMDGGRDWAKILSLLQDLVRFCLRLAMLAFRSNYDTVLVKNSVWPLGQAYSEQLVHFFFRGKRIVYDIDDAIYFNLSRQKKNFNILRRNDKKVAYWVQHADKIIVSNEILYEDLRQRFGLAKGKCVFYLSTPFREQYFNSVEKVVAAKPVDEVRFIWLGSPHTQENLYVMEGLIEAVPQVFPNAKIILMGCSDSFRLFRDLSYVEFVDWSIKNEVNEMRLAHFGLNPLKDDEFQRRKSAFKVIQYYRAGIIPIVSDVGINRHLTEQYGGYCSIDFQDIESINSFIKDKLDNFTTESEKTYRDSQVLSVEANALKLEKVL